MNKSPLTWVLYGIIVLVIGYLTIHIIQKPPKTSVSEDMALAVPPLPEMVQDPPPPGNEIHDPTMDSEADPERVVMPPPEIPSQRLPEVKPRKKTRIKAIHWDYGFGKAMIETLSIQPEEQERFRTAMLDAREQLDELELAHSTTLSETEDTIEISVSPFKKEGAAVETRLLAELRAILGNDRAAAFLDQAEAELYKKFTFFGRPKQHISIKPSRQADRVLLSTTWTIQPDPDDPMPEGIGDAGGSVREIPNQSPEESFHWIPSNYKQYFMQE